MSDMPPDPSTPDPEQGRSRGRPRVRYADRNEQVRQNMRLYRARRTAEQAALQRALEQLLQAVESGDLQRTFVAGAAVSGIWKESTQRARFLRQRPVSSRQPQQEPQRNGPRP
ncbi:hypothetical protein [Azovibrio restrictus]|uniref:hypothetical protein n=1 Tax=Azovibrio restrictus TaxID=146938 RepID=UPI0026E92E09|nr:hypothetical protein [Azovibrio restrictus]